MGLCGAVQGAPGAGGALPMTARAALGSDRPAERSMWSHTLDDMDPHLTELVSQWL